MCPGGSAFCLSLPLSFRFTGPLGLSSAFGASWSCVLEGGGGLALGGDIAEDTLALRNPRAKNLVAAAETHEGGRSHEVGSCRPSASALSPRAACSCHSLSREEGKNPQWNDRIGRDQVETGKIVSKKASLNAKKRFGDLLGPSSSAATGGGASQLGAGSRECC